MRYTEKYDILGQLVFLASAGLFTGVIMLFLFLMLADLGWLRCSLRDECKGLTFCPEFVSFDPTSEAKPHVQRQRRPPLPKQMPPAFDPLAIPRRIRTIMNLFLASSVVLFLGFRPIWEFFLILFSQ